MGSLSKDPRMCVTAQRSDGGGGVTAQKSEGKVTTQVQRARLPPVSLQEDELLPQLQRAGLLPMMEPGNHRGLSMFWVQRVGLPPGSSSWSLCTGLEVQTSSFPEGRASSQLQRVRLSLQQQRAA